MEIEGRRRNSKVVVENNYVYVTKLTRGPITYFNCIEKACRARAKRRCGVFHLNREHNHKANLQLVEHLQIIASCKARAANCSLPLRKIFEEECGRLPNGAKLVSYRTIERSMLRARRAAEAALPGAPHQYAKHMPVAPKFTETLCNQPLFKALIEDKDAIMVVFTSDAMCQQHLEAATEIHLDMSIRAVPGMFLQLLTIHIPVHSSIFPCIYVLMSYNTEDAYSALLSYIQEHLAPQLNPSLLIAEYDPALSSVLQDKFPSAEQKGCWYHYVKSIRQYVYSLGMLPLCREHVPTKHVVQGMMALPLLPANLMLEGFAIIESMAMEEGPITEAMFNFLNYVIEEWVQRVGVTKWSAYGDFRRTNNNLEIFHNKYLQNVNRLHPEITQFADALRKTEISYRQDFERAQQGLSVSRVNKHRYLWHDRRIQVGINKLESGQYSIKEFLTCTYSATENYITFTTIEESDDNAVVDTSSKDASSVIREVEEGECDANMEETDLEYVPDADPVEETDAVGISDITHIQDTGNVVFLHPGGLDDTDSVVICNAINIQEGEIIASDASQQLIMLYDTVVHYVECDVVE